MAAILAQWCPEDRTFRIRLRWRYNLKTNTYPEDIPLMYKKGFLCSSGRFQQWCRLWCSNWRTLAWDDPQSRALTMWSTTCWYQHICGEGSHKFDLSSNWLKFQSMLKLHAAASKGPVVDIGTSGQPRDCAIRDSKAVLFLSVNIIKNDVLLKIEKPTAPLCYVYTNILLIYLNSSSYILYITVVHWIRSDWTHGLILKPIRLAGR